MSAFLLYWAATYSFGHHPTESNSTFSAAERRHSGYDP